jgi:dihydrofolate reductase
LVTPRLSLIVAMDRGRLIGRDGDLPWRLPNDLKYFKAQTVGKTVLMGRRTWASLGRPLPQRDNWVLTRDRAFRAEGARVFHRLDDALAVHGAGELMVIGGAELYRQVLPLADRLYLTEVDAELDGDTRFPAFDRSQWCEIAAESHRADERHAWPYRFVTLERRA